MTQAAPKPPAHTCTDTHYWNRDPDENGRKQQRCQCGQYTWENRPETYSCFEYP